MLGTGIVGWQLENTGNSSREWVGASLYLVTHDTKCTAPLLTRDHWLEQCLKVLLNIKHQVLRFFSKVQGF